ncbi:TetR/AcrR family transcriptional regulator [Pontibacter sp. SGAir0037]|uniref:TetR/AcrR family transcriptional regulator n=1 Tax=Pontibacter sp. SGAir0037 TaxID=2571030 RepID=UPI0010CD2E75|nr:TetR/AcrR family transcriptional regulator [Pontibacter sp. SGAir0037]QCR22455.1 TetR/AcrR family transcriptional regulator [Pontibacter sp. SGAir0037]
MGIAERKKRHKEELRSSILEAAWELVVQDGWQALSIRKIAEVIEYSVPVIYDHFANKEAILLELTKQGFQHLNQELIKAKAGAGSYEKQVEAMADAYWKFAFSQKAYYQVMYGLGIPSCEKVNQINELATFSELVLEPIHGLIASGNSPDTDPFLKLHTFWSMLHGLVSINMMGAEEGREDMNQMVLKDFIRGFISSMKA